MESIMSRKIGKFRTIIQESLRVQEGSAEDVKYVDFGTVVSDVSVKQNHVIFARRGCGKTLLLRYTARNLPTDIRAIYLNCEDFKRHSFPNVLIEILDSLFRELDRNLKNWFGLNTKIKKSLNEIRAKLSELKTAEDTYYAEVKSSRKSELKTDAKIAANAKSLGVGGSASLDHISKIKDETEESFKVRKEKLRELDLWLPELKDRVRDFFRNTNRIKNIFIQIDDLYQLRRDDQPFVVDYVHRLCKDVPLFFKIATLKHTSTLYVERLGQPIGAQERHDFQPVNIDYTFADFRRTRDQNKEIFRGFGKQAGLKPEEVDALFMGKGFDRLVWAGGGVPRDTLSLFLEIHQEIRGESIGKDQVRLLSKSNLERRIEELKQDSHIAEQENLIKAIYVIRNFCLEKHTNSRP
jgi:hypothetical protein